MNMPSSFQPLKDSGDTGNSWPMQLIFFPLKVEAPKVIIRSKKKKKKKGVILDWILDQEQDISGSTVKN